jgi:hypothetical protein
VNTCFYSAGLCQFACGADFIRAATVTRDACGRLPAWMCPLTAWVWWWAPWRESSSRRTWSLRYSNSSNRWCLITSCPSYDAVYVVLCHLPWQFHMYEYVCRDAFLSTNTPPHVSYCTSNDVLNHHYTTLYPFLRTMMQFKRKFQRNYLLSTYCEPVYNVFSWLCRVNQPLPPLPRPLSFTTWQMVFKNYFSSLTIFFTKSCRLPPPTSV